MAVDAVDAKDGQEIPQRKNRSVQDSPVFGFFNNVARVNQIPQKKSFTSCHKTISASKHPKNGPSGYLGDLQSLGRKQPSARPTLPKYFPTNTNAPPAAFVLLILLANSMVNEFYGCLQGIEVHLR